MAVNARAGSILKLPEDVVAQIKSSSSIVSLADVVLELLKNALDAGATKIEGTVDFGRGGCTMEDDGLGIAPLEFGEEGGLGKRYCTSKYFSEDACLGRHGTFLASLAAVSLLAVTSHHHEHRSTNSITFHHSKTVERQLPAAARDEVKYEQHGTRVTVRNLFGNLPVRVKQRAIQVEQKVEQARLWDALKRDVVGLLLSWQRPVSLKIRDADHKTAFNFTAQTGPTPAITHNPTAGKRRSEGLQSLLNILTQADFISVNDWSSWVPASASTSRISIKGAISLEPAPSRRIQFISLGVRPLSSHAGHNELYDEVNRIFNQSSFGTVEDEVDLDEGEKIRRENDKRFKNDGYTNRQLKGRKGVDRHPMFHLRISLKDELPPHTSEDTFLDQESNLQAVVEVLRAMVTQWLSVHHFRPRKHPFQRALPNAAPASATESLEEEENLAVTTSPFDRRSAAQAPLRPTSANIESRKRKRSTIATSGTSTESRRHSAFNDWSRIKSGKSDVYDNLWSVRKRGELDTAKETPNTPLDSTETLPPHDFATFTAEPILPGSLDSPIQHTNSSTEDIDPKGTNDPADQDDRDETMTWTNPTTKQTYLLNARTGCVLPETVSRSHDAASTGPSRSQVSHKSLRLRKRPQTSDDPKNPWLNGVLQTWTNPIFKSAEKGIQQVSLEEPSLDSGCASRSNHFHCSRVEIDKAFNGSSISASSKLSKDGLRNAQVINQLDKKFILVKMSSSPEQFSNNSEDQSELLVLIDQHAADERIRVESLLAELCAPLAETSCQYRSKLGQRSQVAFSLLDKPLQFSISPHESELFTIHSSKFATWGILFEISSSKPPPGRPSTIEREQSVLSVTALPPSIAERCKADPKLLISFLRATVWKYVEDPPTLPPPQRGLSQPTTAEEDVIESPLWLRRLSSCPQGLVDLVNSRACRSAIMFNDELSKEQCEELVVKLAGCVFPFMCAHGRPSMVPLVNLGGEGHGLGLTVAEERGEGKGFVDVWKTWKGK